MRIFCPLKHGMEGHREAFARGIGQLYDRYDLAEERVDVIHAHCCVWAGYAAMKLSERTGIPYVITEHATLFELHRDQISRSNDRHIREAFGKAAKVICVSRAFAKKISKYRTSDDLEVIGNVVDFDRFRICDNESHSGMRFLTVCYMNTEDQLRKKGVDVLLGAWKDFSGKQPAARLLIGGDGPARQKAMEWCRNYGVESSVDFIGALSREQVAARMQACDAFVLPSRYETFGVVYIEAMACGKPVIAAANGGPDDFVTEDNGILIPPDDTGRLVQAMEQMVQKMQDQKAYDAEVIRNSVRERFGGQAIAGQLERVYEAVGAGS